MSGIATDVNWLGTLGNEDLFEIAQLKWRTFTVEFNPKQVYPLDHASSIIIFSFDPNLTLFVN